MYPWLEDAQRPFRQQLASGRLAHACLLTGPAGLGKAHLAMHWVADLLCTAAGGSACGQCRSCILLRGGAHPDFRQVTLEINAQTMKQRTVITVDQVRDLIGALQLTNSISQRKAAVIHPAEAMHASAANALLKTLEDPPGDAVMILVASNPSRLPPTIRSRCQEFPVRMPAWAAARCWLMQQASCAEAAADLALRAAAGNPLVALGLIESDQAGRFRQLEQILDALSHGQALSGETLSALAELEPETLWRWLSLLAAGQVRRQFGATEETPGSAVASSIPATRIDAAKAARFARLQLLADRNYLQLATSVRRDLLLRDWLIQWRGKD